MQLPIVIPKVPRLHNANRLLSFKPIELDDFCWRASSLGNGSSSFCIQSVDRRQKEKKTGNHDSFVQHYRHLG